MRRPQRVRDAGIIMIVLASILAMGQLVFLGFAAFGSRNPSWWQLAFWVVMVLAIFGFCLLIGWKTQERRLWALWAGLVTTLLLVIVSVCVVVATILEAQRSCLGGLIILMMIAFGGVFAPVLILTLLFIYVCALLAYYTNRNVMRWLRGGNGSDTDQAS
jgi:hypothetical protein